jgi:dolichyl-phosphate-mannose--protein O-mannosyl transferase
VGVRRPVLRAALVDAVPAFFSLVGVALVVYLATWSGWLLHAHAYEVALSDTQYGPYWGSYLERDARGFLPELTQSLRSLWHYHHDVYSFHTRGLSDATHSYQSHPGGWLLLNRPVGVEVELDIAPGTQGCAAAMGSTCLRQVILLGTPVLWWGGCLALLYAVYAWLGRRDWRFGLAVVGVVSTWLPWLRYDDRPIFSYYAVATLPFLVVALTLVLGKLLGASTASDRRRLLGGTAAGVFVVLVLANFAWFWPIYTDELIARGDWLRRIWFRTWI